MPLGKVEPIPVTNPRPGTGVGPSIKRGKPGDVTAKAINATVTCLFATTEDLPLAGNPSLPAEMNKFRVRVRRVIAIDKKSGIENEDSALADGNVTTAPLVSYSKIISVERVTNCECLGTFVYRLTLNIVITSDDEDDWDETHYRITIKRKREPAGPGEPPRTKWNVGTAHGKLTPTLRLLDDDGNLLSEEELNAEY